MTIQPLRPLDSGNILIVGTKASNFDEELRTHPRIIMWDSQNEHWTSKDVPSNVRAIFITRWIGHAAFAKIQHEARKKHITIFNPEGTGQIKRQVKELLNIVPPQEPVIEPVRESLFKNDFIKAEELTNTETIVPVAKSGPGMRKLNVLHSFIDYKLNNTENARRLLVKAREQGITTTLASLAQLVSVQRRKTTGKGLKQPFTVKVSKQQDVAVQMLDNMVKELQDMREYLVATTEENRVLKARIQKFKAVLSND